MKETANQKSCHMLPETEGLLEFLAQTFAHCVQTDTTADLMTMLTRQEHTTKECQMLDRQCVSNGPLDSSRVHCSLGQPPGPHLFLVPNDDDLLALVSTHLSDMNTMSSPGFETVIPSFIKFASR